MNVETDNLSLMLKEAYEKTNQLVSTPKKKISVHDIIVAASSFTEPIYDSVLKKNIIPNIQPEAIMAVLKVESNGSGFFNDNEPTILFEGHVFWKELLKRGIDPVPLSKKYPNIVYPKFTREFYTKGRETEKLNIAKSINHSAAITSASWGLFQIMGFNYAKCGYKTVEEFVADQYTSEFVHLLCFMRFIKSSNLLDELHRLDWAGLALGYNGKGYAKLKYDIRLAEEYNKCKKNGMKL